MRRCQTRRDRAATRARPRVPDPALRLAFPRAGSRDIWSDGAGRPFILPLNDGDHWVVRGGGSPRGDRGDGLRRRSPAPAAGSSRPRPRSPRWRSTIAGSRRTPPPRCATSRSRARGSPPARNGSAAGSNAISTTVRSSGSSPCGSSSSWRRSSWSAIRRPDAGVSTSSRGTSTRRSRSSGRSPTASIRRCSPTADWPTRCGPSPRGRRSASSSTRDGVGRYPPELESAVYYCVLEALQNALKHARARAGSWSSSTAARAAGSRFVVRDDGSGVAAGRRAARPVRASRACATASPPSAARSTSRPPPASARPSAARSRPTRERVRRGSVRARSAAGARGDARPTPRRACARRAPACAGTRRRRVAGSRSAARAAGRAR